MAIVVTKEPADISFSGDPMYVELFSHNIDLNQRAEISITVSGSLADGDTFDLLWNNYKLSFVARTSAEDDGLDLPLQGGLTATQYLSLIRSAFASNATFQRFWTATIDGTAVILRYKTTDELTPLVEGSAPAVTITITNSTGALKEENLVAHILTTEVNDNETEEDLIQLVPISIFPAPSILRPTCQI